MACEFHKTSTWNQSNLHVMIVIKICHKQYVNTNMKVTCNENEPLQYKQNYHMSKRLSSALTRRMCHAREIFLRGWSF